MEKSYDLLFLNCTIAKYLLSVPKEVPGSFCIPIRWIWCSCLLGSLLPHCMTFALVTHTGIIPQFVLKVNKHLCLTYIPNPLRFSSYLFTPWDNIGRSKLFLSSTLQVRKESVERDSCGMFVVLICAMTTLILNTDCHKQTQLLPSVQ